MARSYQKYVDGGSVQLIADLTTIGGGRAVSIRNPHATESIVLGGDENVTANANVVAGSLTANNGFILAAGKTYSCVLEGSNEKIYGASVSGTVTITVSVFRTNGDWSPTVG